MQRSLRRKTIIRAIPETGEIRVDALVRLTGASPITIRRDLTELAEAGVLRRTHGGAARPSKRGIPMPFAMRSDEHQASKRLLAAAAAELIGDDESLIIDNGTTCQAVALALAGRPVTAIALSLHAAAALASIPGASVVVPGGAIENDTLAFSGAQALRAVRDVRVDVAILGACSAAIEEGLTSTNYDDAQVKAACLGAARRSVLVATADKLSRTSTFRFGSAADLTHLVTTSAASDEVIAAFRGAGVQVVVVDDAG
ncbi:DeoR/GlpR family DNA-binding transcription regulator [Nostocoides veronense]|uniref:Lactose phosphotransferase system repressor n=1 Tax=Nostocoides veronense TaxID=330836 RepID=A0ABN2M270_9MICO